MYQNHHWPGLQQQARSLEPFTLNSDQSASSAEMMAMLEGRNGHSIAIGKPESQAALHEID